MGRCNACDSPGENVYNDDYFVIRYFQKGSAHLTFKRLALVEKMNDIIAKHYPGMLANNKTCPKQC